MSSQSEDKKYQELPGLSNTTGLLFDIKLDLSWETNFTWNHYKFAALLSITIAGQIVHKYKTRQKEGIIIAKCLYENLKVPIMKQLYTGSQFKYEEKCNLCVSGLCFDEDLIIDSTIIHDRLTYIASMVPSKSEKLVHHKYSDTVQYFVKFYLSPISKRDQIIFIEKGFPIFDSRSSALSKKYTDIMDNIDYDKADYNDINIWKKVLDIYQLF